MRNRHLDLLASSVLLRPSRVQHRLPATSPLLVVFPDELVRLAHAGDERRDGSQGARSGGIVSEG